MSIAKAVLNNHTITRGLTHSYRPSSNPEKGPHRSTQFYFLGIALSLYSPAVLPESFYLPPGQRLIALSCTSLPSRQLTTCNLPQLSFSATITPLGTLEDLAEVYSSGSCPPRAQFEYDPHLELFSRTLFSGGNILLNIWG